MAKRESEDRVSAAVRKRNHHSDCISSLPDEIIHHILSFVSTIFTIRTSVLSKRWKHVWRVTPYFSIDFNKDCCGIDPSLINEILISIYASPKITSFYLLSNYELAASYYAESWIKLAVSRKAEKLSLEFKAKHRFQDFFFKNSSVKQLSVALGLFDSTPIVSWTSLRSLSLRYCRLSDESIANVLSGCPMLGSLTLKSCSGLHRLDLSKSLRLTRLNIRCNQDLSIKPIEIVAPHIHYLRLRNTRRPFELVDVSSLTEAKLHRFYLYISFKFSDDNFDFIQDTMVKMLAKLQNIEKLTIGPNCLQILSLAELRGVALPQFNIKDLIVETRIIRSVIPGIIRLLQNSPGVKKITLHTKKHRVILDEEQHLKRYLDRQGLNTDHCWSGVFPKVDAESSKHMASFIELLLQNTMILETMVLRLDGYLKATEYQKLLPTVSSHKNTNIKILP